MCKWLESMKKKQNNGTEQILKIINPRKVSRNKSLNGTGYRLVDSKTYPNKTTRL